METDQTQDTEFGVGDVVLVCFWLVVLGLFGFLIMEVLKLLF